MKLLPPKFLAAMIALRPLPGAPLYDGDDKRIMEQAVDDLENYKKAGVDSVLIANDFDIPFIKPPLPKEALAVTTTIAKKIRKQFEKPIGIELLEAANMESLEIAAEARLDYLRVEGFVYGHVGTAGIIEGCGGKLLRRRKELRCEHIKVFGDIKKKHTAHAITGDLDITDEVMQAELDLIDGIIVTGKFTRIKPNTEDVIKVKKVTSLPVIIGSGMTKENIAEFLQLADGFIVGSTFRKDGKFLEKLDPKRLHEFMSTFLSLRKQFTRVQSH